MYNPYRKEILPGQMTYIRGIDKNIFIGDLISANDFSLLTRNNILTVISLLENEDIVVQYPNIDYHKFIIEDGKGDIISVGEKVSKILENGGNILVHCYAGKSRSASVVIYYLMVKNNISYGDARKIVKNSRNIITPDSHYKKQLMEFRLNNKK